MSSGTRGFAAPTFVWAATGPALEAYSRHPVVKKANDPGKTMEVSEFLSHVRRMVVDFVVGRVLTGRRSRSQELFRRLLQSLIELSPRGSDERSLLESLSNHVQARGAKPEDRRTKLPFGEKEA